MNKKLENQREQTIKEALEKRYGKHKRGARYSKRKLSGQTIEEVKGEKDNG